MADGEESEELMDHISLLILATVGGVRKGVGATVQDVSHLLEGLPSILLALDARTDQFGICSFTVIHGFGVCYTRNATAFELHLVASERSGLVTEDVFDLTKFLDE